MLDKQDLLQIKEVMQEVVRTELDAAKEELRGEMRALEERLHGEIVAVKEELHGEIVAVKEELHGEIVAVKEELHGEIVAVRKELYEKIMDVKSDQGVILDEIERTRNILENRMSELESCYRSDRLEHDAMNMQCGDLEKRVGRLERKMA